MSDGVDVGNGVVGPGVGETVGAEVDVAEVGASVGDFVGDFVGDAVGDLVVGCGVGFGFFVFGFLGFFGFLVFFGFFVLGFLVLGFFVFGFLVHFGLKKTAFSSTSASTSISESLRRPPSPETSAVTDTAAMATIRIASNPRLKIDDFMILVRVTFLFTFGKRRNCEHT